MKNAVKNLSLSPSLSFAIPIPSFLNPIIEFLPPSNVPLNGVPLAPIGVQGFPAKYTELLSLIVFPSKSSVPSFTILARPASPSAVSITNVLLCSLCSLYQALSTVPFQISGLFDGLSIGGTIIVGTCLQEERSIINAVRRNTPPW